MNLRTLAIALTLAALAAFALLNWAAFTAPTALSLGFAEVQAPLGLIMLVTTGLVSALFLIYIVLQQAGVILEARRYAKELKAHRELADTAEASRFTELRSFLESELSKLAAQHAADLQQLQGRIEQLERQVLERLEESTGSLSACIGEVDDKLDRQLGLPRN
jgi:biopolymer transport protein ExbB/TolQ